MQGIRALILFFILTMCSSNVLAADIITLGIYQDHLDNINDFIEHNGCQDLTTADFGENQILAEYLILCNALKTAENSFQLVLTPYPVNQRVVAALEENAVIGTAMGVWSFDVKSSQSVKLSEPLLRKGEFVKGLYTTQKKARLLAVEDIIHHGIGLLNQNWEYDWQSLSCFGFQLRHVSRYGQMFGMLEKDRGDFIPLTFGTGKALKREQFGIELYPIKGYKMAFPFTLNFAVNNTSEIGKQLFAALNKGLTKLREDQQVLAVYTRLGIVNAVHADWQNIQCE